MLTDAELITLRDALEILVHFQIRESKDMQSLNDESLSYHQKAIMVSKARTAEWNFARFVHSFPEK